MVYNWFEAGLIPLIVPYSLSFIALLIGSVTDLKTREVPDWVNYGLMLSGVGLNLLFSAIYSNPSFIINSLIGLAVFFGIAYTMFYAGQWGGGDSKMIMGLGAMLGIDVSFKTQQFLVGFFVNALFAGAIYGLIWSIFLVFKNKKKFLKEAEKALSRKEAVKYKKIILAVLVLLLISVFFVGFWYFKILVLSLALLILTTFYLWIFVKAIEKSCMHKLIEPTRLTEGDWIVNDIFVNKQYICGPKDLGISKSQIKKLIGLYKKGKVRKVLIKEGIPFVPSFFIAFAATLVVGNPLILLTYRVV
ncbi:prepilin peptidase [Candidatus Woesearchaeota archaeon]|nr:prepilin peptidase [Candidatus Woesearchaeota archaeon]